MKGLMSFAVVCLGSLQYLPYANTKQLLQSHKNMAFHRTLECTAYGAQRSIGSLVGTLVGATAGALVGLPVGTAVVDAVMGTPEGAAARTVVGEAVGIDPPAVQPVNLYSTVYPPLRYRNKFGLAASESPGLGGPITGAPC